MRVSFEKTQFIKSDVEFLFFVVSEDLRKVIINYEIPKILRTLHSFLGLSNCYRRFIKDYALIVKLHDTSTRKNRTIDNNAKKNIEIILDDEALGAFRQIKYILVFDMLSIFFLGKIHNRIKTNFPAVKLVHTQRLMTDIFNRVDQKEVLHTEHNRAHRSLKENIMQVLGEYYFPNKR